MDKSVPRVLRALLVALLLLPASGRAAIVLDNVTAPRGLAVAPPPGCQTGADCADGNPCTSDVCNAGTCENPPTNEGLACDDGLFCNTGETCQAETCTGGTARDCSAAGDQCNVGLCNDTLDLCERSPVLDGTPCDDLAFCTTGACGGGSASRDSLAGKGGSRRREQPPRDREAQGLSSG